MVSPWTRRPALSSSARACLLFPTSGSPLCVGAPSRLAANPIELTLYTKEDVVSAFHKSLTAIEELLGFVLEILR